MFCTGKLQVDNKHPLNLIYPILLVQNLTADLTWASTPEKDNIDEHGKNIPENDYT